MSFDRWFYPDGINYRLILPPLQYSYATSSKSLDPDGFYFEEYTAIREVYDPNGDEINFGDEKVDALYYKGYLVSFIIAEGQYKGKEFAWNPDEGWYLDKYGDDYEMWWAGYIIRAVYGTSRSIQELGNKITWQNLPEALMKLPEGIDGWLKRFGNAGAQRKVGMLYSLHLSFNGGGLKYIGVLGIPTKIIPRPLNTSGVPYPRIIVEGFGEVPFPKGPFPKTASAPLRKKFTTSYKKKFKTWWTDEMGRPWPTPQPGQHVSIHHIKPLSKGGSNSFENLVPLIEQTQHIHFTRWWYNYP